MANEPTGVVLDQLEVCYPRTTQPAVQRLSLTVPAGSFHAILGPSGCGKSTVLKVLAGLLPATSGTVSVPDGGIAYVPQGNSCFPWLTVQDNVGYALAVQGVGKSQRRRIAIDLLERIGLAGYARKYPSELSEGMRQRVAIARAFAVEAPVLLMDEPLSALDFQTKVRIQDELLTLWRERRTTVLYVTHDIDEALAMADDVTVLTGRPGTVRDTLHVPFGRPRSYRDIRSAPGYGPLFARCYELLDNEAPAHAASA